MGFNIGGGLSAMGGAIADTAGKEALEMQKADLDEQRVRLADSLAGTREAAGDARRFQQAKDLIPLTADSQIKVAKATAENAADIALKQVPLLAAAQEKVSKEQASDPEFLRSLRLITDAKATVAERASAAASMQQVVGLKLQNAAALEVENARTDLQKAVTANDTDAIQAAQRRMAVATYSAKDEVQAAAVQKGVADSARLYLESIDGKIARITGSTQANTPAAKSQLAMLNAERSAAELTYKSLTATAIAAAKNVPDINIGAGNAKPGAPALSDIFSRPGATATPGAGFINAPPP